MGFHLITVYVVWDRERRRGEGWRAESASQIGSSEKRKTFVEDPSHRGESRTGTIDLTKRVTLACIHFLHTTFAAPIDLRERTRDVSSAAGLAAMTPPFPLIVSCPSPPSGAFFSPQNGETERGRERDGAANRLSPSLPLSPVRSQR